MLRRQQQYYPIIKADTTTPKIVFNQKIAINYLPFLI